MDGVVKEVPVPKEEPPEEAAYQFNVADPLDAVAESVTVPVPQREPPVEVEMLGVALIVAVIAVLEAVVQPFKVASK